MTRSPWGTGCAGTGFVVWFPKDEPDYGDQEPWFTLLHEAMHAYYGFWGPWYTEAAATLCQRIAVNAMFRPASREARHAQESDEANEIRAADLRYYAQREPEMVQHLKQKLRELGYDPDLTPWRT